MSERPRLTIGVLLFLQTLFVGSSFDTGAIMLVVALLAMWMVRIMPAIRARVTGKSQGTRVYVWHFGILVSIVSVVTLTIVWRASEHLGETLNPIYMGIDVLAHVLVTCGLVIWCVRPDKGVPAMLGMGLLVAMLCISAGGGGRSLISQTTSAFLICVAFLMGSLVLSRASTGVRAVSATESNDISFLGRTRSLLMLLTLSLMLLSTSAVAMITDRVLPAVQDAVQDRIENSLDTSDSRKLIGGMRYVRGSRLGSIREHLMNNPSEVALRVRSDAAPGYLRGTVFDAMSNRNWHEVNYSRLKPEMRSQAFLSRRISATADASTKLEGYRGQMRFPISSQIAGEKTISLTVIGEPAKGNKIFTPLESRWIEGRGRAIAVSNHGLVDSGLDIREPYVVGAGTKRKQESLDENRRRLFLVNADNDQADFAEFANGICSGRVTPREKARAIERYFQSEFEYSTEELPETGNGNPLLHFLAVKHPAHCEYFASATALLLRSVGVPTRYVTGYVCTESGDEESNWLARNRDAHAWVEAYDDVSQEWFAVESTPGRRYRSVSSDNELTTVAGTLGTAMQDELDNAQTFLSGIWSWLISFRARTTFGLIAQIIQVPLLFVLTFVLWRRLRDTGGHADQDNVRSWKMLRRADRRMRRYNLVRMPHETIHQFADRVEAQLVEHPTLYNVATWYRDYASARYRGQMPTKLA